MGQERAIDDAQLRNRTLTTGYLLPLNPLPYKGFSGYNPKVKFEVKLTVNYTHKSYGNYMLPELFFLQLCHKKHPISVITYVGQNA